MADDPYPAQDPYSGAGLSWFFAATFTWIGNRYFTFRATRAHGLFGAAGEWLRFLAANAVGGLVNVGTSIALKHWGPAPLNNPYVALMCGVLVGLVFNFTLSRKVVFKGPTRPMTAWIRDSLPRAFSSAGCCLLFDELVLPASGPTLMVRIRSASWSAGDERDYGEFIAAIGASGCRTVDACLHASANPFAASDPKGSHFRSDCADLPYVLRFYYAWKRGLPFSYVSDVSPRGRSRDIRYSPRGNQVEARRDVLTRRRWPGGPGDAARCGVVGRLPHSSRAGGTARK